MPFKLSLAEVQDILECHFWDSITLSSSGCRLAGSSLSEEYAAALLEEVTGVFTDSREVGHSSLFVARNGERMDGHDYLYAAYQKGARVAVVERSWLDSHWGEFAEKFRCSNVANSGGCGNFTLLAVRNTTLSLGKLARAWRRKLNLPCIAITGSVGKTTAKEYLHGMCRCLLGQGVASAKSYNNEVGLPLTILRSSPEDKYLILEAGMNHPGELSYLGSIALPDVVLELGVGAVHLEHFGSLAEISDAKCELLAHLRENGCAVINADSSELVLGLQRFEHRHGVLARKRFYGAVGGASFGESGSCEQVRRSCLFELVGLTAEMFPRIVIHSSVDIVGDIAGDIAGDTSVDSPVDTVCESRRPTANESLSFVLPQYGAHHAYNFLGAFCAFQALWPEFSIQQIAEAAREVKFATMRFEVEMLGSVMIINDAYNANPISMRAAIETVAELGHNKRICLVLGDMLELGDDSVRYHREMGELAGASGVKSLIAVGRFADSYLEGARRYGAKGDRGVEHLEKVELSLPNLGQEVARLALGEVKPEIVLVKGSRGVALERVVEGLHELLSSVEGDLV